MRKIGKGGHGVVCLARDILEDRNYVIKVFFKERISESLIDPFFKKHKRLDYLIIQI